MVSAVLSPPGLPQMSNDGYINAAELLSARGVAIAINLYSNAGIGDYLCLYWNNEVAATLWLTADNIDTVFPWQIVIPQGLVPDGTYPVYFTATDTYQNIAASGIATAIVDRSHTGTLPPPLLPDEDATGTISYSSVTYHNGTHISIPVPEAGIRAGDTVNIYWEGFDLSGNPLPGSTTSFTHEVTSADLQGFSVLVAPAFVTVINEGTAMAWYSFTDSSSNVQNSDSAIAVIDMSLSGQYAAPIFAAGSDGWLDCAECAGGVDIVVPPSDLFVASGTVAVYWQGYDISGSAVAGAQATLSHTLVAKDITDGFTVTVDAAYVTPVGIGMAQATYQVMSPATPGYSALAQVGVDTEHCALLPAPAFPAAQDDGVISFAEVNADDGTEMNVSWPEMAEGDTVTIFWTGYLNTPDSPVPGANWTKTRMLTQREAQAQNAGFHIPASTITPVGNGYGAGRYQVMFKSGGIAASATTGVKVNTEASGGLQMVCGNGAPVFNPALLVRPLNNVTLYGSPGEDIELSLPGSASAYFYPSGEEILSVRLDENGTGSAEVCGLVAGNYTVSAWVSSDPSIAAVDTITFLAWTAGHGQITSWGTSTGGAANGTGTCRVYLHAASTVGTTAQVKLSLTGSGIHAGVLPDEGLSGTTQIDSTYTAAFDVEDTVAESIGFMLSVEDSSESYVPGTLSFEGFVIPANEQ